jgi:hypothetical protein
LDLKLDAEILHCGEAICLSWTDPTASHISGFLEKQAPPNAIASF